MSAAEKWYLAAREVYEGDDQGRMFDRTMKAKSDADRVVFEFLMLQELRALRAAIQAQAERKASR